MSAKLTRRNLALGGTLLATLVISAWALLSGTNDDVVEPVARAAKGPVSGLAKPRAAHSAGGGGTTSGELALGQRPQPPANAINLFSAYTYQAAAAAPVVQAPASPHAPPLPFTYTGHLEIDGVDTYLLLQGDAPSSIAVGGVVGEFTLVEARIDGLVFLHGPTGERVVMPIAAVAH